MNVKAQSKQREPEEKKEEKEEEEKKFNKRLERKKSDWKATKSRLMQRMHGRLQLQHKLGLWHCLHHGGITQTFR